MKFRRKAANVQVGYGLSPVLYGLDGKPRPIMQVIEENGRAFEVPFEQFLAQYEPGDDMAQAFLDGLNERHAEATAPPQLPEMPSYEITEDNRGDGKRTVQVRPIQKKSGSKKRP